MNFLTMGDLGDCLYLMPSMKFAAEITGEPATLYCKDGLRAHDPFIPRMPMIKDLFEAQDYIDAVRPWDGERIDFDASRFRDHGYPFGVTLAKLQAQAVGLGPDLSRQWIQVDPMPQTHGSIVVARSHRYRNFRFPWTDLVRTFGEHMFFVGLSNEFVDFCAAFGEVRYLPTKDLYEVAKAIAGSSLFIGNQSSPYAVCEGLKHASLQETCLEVPDCIFPRDNAAFCFDGGVSVVVFGRSLETPHAAENQPRANPNECPPNGWRIKIGGLSAKSYALNIVIDEIKYKLRAANIPIPENLRELIIDQSSVDLPPSPPFAPTQWIRDMIGR